MHRILTYIIAVVCAMLIGSGTVWSQDGTLDPTFAGDGLVITTLGTFDDAAIGMALQRDRRIVVVGHTYLDGRYAFVVARYLLNGAPDSSFGTNGVTTTFIGTGDARAQAVAIQNDGDIVVAGLSVIDAREVLTVARYNEKTGALDNTFNGTGIVQTPVGTGWSAAHAVAIDAEGRIMAAGYSQSGPDYVMALVRYQKNGELDPTFGSNGIVTVQFSIGNDVAHGLAIGGPDNIYLAGSSHRTGSNTDVAIAMVKSSGELNGAFGSGGKYRHASVGAFNEYGFGMTLQRDGKPVVVGYTNSLFHDVLVTRYTQGGELDTEFGVNGIVTTDVGTGTDYGEASTVAVQSDDKIVVAGLRNYGSKTDFALIRYMPNGSVDRTFGDTGFVSTDFGNSDDGGRAIAIQFDGKILVAGHSHDGTQGRIAIARYNNPSVAAPTSVSSSEESRVRAVPNPFTTSTTLSFDHELLQPAVQLFDVYGRALQHTLSIDSTSIRLYGQSLPPGTYVVRVVEADGTSAVFHVIMSR
jgi:uncharacterized delta-60 repeat protein